MANVTRVTVRYKTEFGVYLCLVAAVLFFCLEEIPLDTPSSFILSKLLAVLCAMAVLLPVLLGFHLCSVPYITVEDGKLILGRRLDDSLRLRDFKHEKGYRFDRLVVGKDAITSYFDDHERTIPLRRWMLNRDDLRQLEELASESVASEVSDKA